MRTETMHDYGERWDATDLAALRFMRGNGLSWSEIASRLGRTVSACRSKDYRLRTAKA